MWVSHGESGGLIDTGHYNYTIKKMQKFPFGPVKTFSLIGYILLHNVILILPGPSRSTFLGTNWEIMSSDIIILDMLDVNP